MESDHRGDIADLLRDEGDQAVQRLLYEPPEQQPEVAELEPPEQQPEVAELEPLIDFACPGFSIAESMQRAYAAARFNAEHGAPKVPTPWPAINDLMIGGLRGGMHFLVGPAASNKSTIAKHLSWYAAHKGIATGYFAFELHEDEIQERDMFHQVLLAKEILQGAKMRGRAYDDLGLRTMNATMLGKIKEYQPNFWQRFLSGDQKTIYANLELTQVAQHVVGTDSLPMRNYYPRSRMLSVEFLKDKIAEVDKLRAPNDERPTLIVLDYLQLINSGNPRHTDIERIRIVLEFLDDFCRARKLLKQPPVVFVVPCATQRGALLLQGPPPGDGDQRPKAKGKQAVGMTYPTLEDVKRAPRDTSNIEYNAHSIIGVVVPDGRAVEADPTGKLAGKVFLGFGKNRGGDGLGWLTMSVAGGHPIVMGGRHSTLEYCVANIPQF